MTTAISKASDFNIILNSNTVFATNTSLKDFTWAYNFSNVEEGDYAGRVFYMNKSQAIDRFGWRMQEEQIRMLYPKDMTDRAGNVYGEFFNATQFPFPAYRDYANVTTSLGYDPFNNTPVGNLPALTTEDLNTGFPNYQFATGEVKEELDS